MEIAIIYLPLLSAIACGFFGRYLGSNGSTKLSSFLIFISFCFSLISFSKANLFGTVVSFTIASWVSCGSLNFNWGFLFDSLTVVMLIVVTSVSTLVHLYSSSYIEEDPHLPRFISYLSLFTFFILILVTADNFIQIFVGWEGVGLCSFLLINFWFTRIQANKAAIKAILVNRVGDFGLSLGIFAIFFKFGAVDYATVFSLAPFFVETKVSFLGFDFFYLDLVCFLLFIGSVGKSAQLGLHTWLPDAIEGPTPVSALIHAATIVTAGVFLIVRCSPLFEFSPNVLWVVTIVGAITAFFAATTGLLQNDLKKVIAYSTCSQLGYIIFACGVSGYNVGVFHLANHAFFKALLFLTAGCVIHAINDEQDIRKMGGLVRLLPFSYAIMFVGSIALMGFPFLSGFYSKDVILEFAYAHYTNAGHFAYFFGTTAAFFTAFYSIRLLHLTFLSKPRGFKKVFEHVHESPLNIRLPLIVLFFGSIFFGYLCKDIIIGFGSFFFSHSIFVHPKHFFLSEAEFLPLKIKLIPLFFSFSGFLFSYYFYYFFVKELFYVKKSHYGRSLYVFLNRKWFFDKVYNEFISQKFINASYAKTYSNLDKGLFELFGPFGLSKVVYSTAYSVSKWQSGQLYHYTVGILSFLLFVCCLSLLHFFSFFDFRLLAFLLIFFVLVFLGV